MKSDLEKTQHFSTRVSELLEGIVIDNTDNLVCVDPFCGAGDLVKFFPQFKWETYDKDPKYPNTTKRDTLINPPNYTGKVVITNPPYIAKNKTKEFGDIFDKYHTDDLYKASIRSIIGCEKGIFIIPVNFFIDEDTRPIREEFLSQYIVKRVNVFTKQMFDNTTYSVCAFDFYKGQKLEQDVLFHVDTGDEKIIKLNHEYGYKPGGKDFYKIKAVKNYMFSRLLESGNNTFITNIRLYGLDTRTTKAHLEICDEPYFGKSTDRVNATITSKLKLTPNEEKRLVESFNQGVEKLRKDNLDIFFSNYRDFGRKRISLDFVYKYLQVLYLGMSDLKN